MSTYYVESNAEGTRDLFNKKNIYAAKVNQYTSAYRNLTDSSMEKSVANLFPKPLTTRAG